MATVGAAPVWFTWNRPTTRSSCFAWNRIRSTVSALFAPDCGIDAGGVPVHWITDVQPAQSVALLASLAKGMDGGRNGAISAIAMHARPAADQVLDHFLAPDQPQ